MDDSVDLSCCMCDFRDTAAVLAQDTSVENTAAVCDSSCCNPSSGDKTQLNKCSGSGTEAGDKTHTCPDLALSAQNSYNIALTLFVLSRSVTVLSWCVSLLEGSRVKRWGETAGQFGRV